MLGSAPRFALTLFLFSLALWFAPALSAVDMARGQTNEVNEDDIESRYTTRVLEKAAEYRLARSQALVSEADEKNAAEYARQAYEMLATGKPQALEGGWRWLSPRWWFVNPSRERRATWLGSDGFEEYPYTKAAGDLLAVQVSSHARRGNIADLHNRLFELWFFIPDYTRTRELMEEAMDATERAQNFTAAIDLEADDPREVIRLDASPFDSEIKRVYRFMQRHGDRIAIQPRAALGLARSLLLGGDRDSSILARREYERFCEDYPTHPLIFNALCERALSYLVSYRGDKYEVGVLISAAAIIDQAEIEAQGNPEKIKIIEAYRKRIRAWHQARDLTVARWYRDRAWPGLSWLTAPKGNTRREWLVSARYYYREVIRRDSGTEPARAALRELSELPLPTASELGAPLPLPPGPVAP
jgi:hypothetical protein